MLCQSYETPGGRWTCWPDAAALVQIPVTGSAASGPHPLVMLFEYGEPSSTVVGARSKAHYEQTWQRWLS